MYRVSTVLGIMIGAGPVWGNRTDTGQASSPKWAKAILPGNLLSTDQHFPHIL